MLTLILSLLTIALSQNISSDSTQIPASKGEAFVVNGGVVYDHMELESTVSIGERRYYVWEAPAHINGVIGYPIGLYVYVEYDMPGRAIKEALVSYSHTAPPFEREDAYALGTVPLDDDSNNRIMVEEDDCVFFSIEAIAPDTLGELTVDMWVILSEGGRALYGGTLNDAPNYVNMIDDRKTIWLDVEEDRYYTFHYSLNASATRHFKVDLKTGGHELHLFGRKGGVPSKHDYDWAITEAKPGTGTIITEQILSDGDWYISVYGENVVWPASTASFRFYASTDGTFSSSGTSSFPCIGAMMTIISLLI